MWHNVGLTLLVFVATLLIVLLLMVCESSRELRKDEQAQFWRLICRVRVSRWESQGSRAEHGWYFVWHLFLSKFKFLRELVGDTGSQEGDREPSGSETEEDASPSPHRISSYPLRHILKHPVHDSRVEVWGSGLCPLPSERVGFITPCAWEDFTLKAGAEEILLHRQQFSDKASEALGTERAGFIPYPQDCLEDRFIVGHVSRFLGVNHQEGWLRGLMKANMYRRTDCGMDAVLSRGTVNELYMGSMDRQSCKA
ncbi:hypothetical protein E5288_WYG019898 [Bos mutus]|uniref:Uncharacterized protein n=1 Tax=Bos mutus TaxID=72004 RepID=A0A6B0RNE8_9CETA|nr:hypothetical protein [Bos mutus]